MFRLAAFAVLLTALPPCALGQTEKEVREEIQRLTNQQQFEQAIDYIRRLQAEKAVPPTALEYELGLVLIQAARHQRSSQQRELLLQDAIDSLEKFRKMEKVGVRFDAASSQLSNAHVELARMLLSRWKAVAPPQRDEQLQAKARQHYAQALETMRASRAAIKKRLELMPRVIDPQDAAAREARDRARADYLQTRLLVPAVLEEQAETHPAGSEQARGNLETAVSEYKEIYEAYRTRVAGLYARLYQGRALGKLGRHREASYYFFELLKMPDNPAAFRDLKHKVIVAAEPSWKQRQADLTLAVEVAAAVDLSGGFSELPARLSIARLCHQLAGEIRKTRPDDPRIAELLGTARQHAQIAADKPGPQQAEAKRLLDTLGS